MDVLEQAATERIESFLAKVVKYKNENNITVFALAEECEISTNAMNSFLNRRTSRGNHVSNARVMTALKVSLALGIEL